MIRQFNYWDELIEFPVERPGSQGYFFTNGNFPGGDAGYLYSVIRHYHPRRIIEIGSGYSSYIILKALEKNREQCSGIQEFHCVEPYRYRRLESLPVNLIKQPVESLPLDFFRQLQPKDILFIDSSHMIRPQGDVLFECLQILPILNSGVFVHFHDIFTPQDYPNDWLIDGNTFWNEQYLLEAFLCGNQNFQIVGALNHLMSEEPELLHRRFPHCGRVSSFWLQKC